MPGHSLGLGPGEKNLGKGSPATPCFRLSTKTSLIANSANGTQYFVTRFSLIFPFFPFLFFFDTFTSRRETN